MARSLPAGWPASTEFVQNPPTIYLHVLDSAWPPASSDGKYALPAGWAECGTASGTQDLVGSLLPGQVKGASGFATTTASASIPQTAGTVLAPWRPGAERVPAGGACELWASYDGPLGSTAFLLGSFRLDPIRGRASEPQLSVELVQDLVRFRQPHNLSAGVVDDVPIPIAQLIDESRSAFGIDLDADVLIADINSSYFAGDTDALTAWQTIVTANLGAMWLSADGDTLVIRNADYMSGDGTVTETIDVLTKLEDLSWTVDPGEIADRIELSYLPPVWATSTADAVFWTAPKGMRLVAGEVAEFAVDPGKPVLDPIWGSIAANTTATGSGSNVDIFDKVTEASSGRLIIRLENTTGSTVYLVKTTGEPSTLSAVRVDVASDPTTISWGVAADQAKNVVTFDAGRNIQLAADADVALRRIVGRISRPSTRVDDVRVVPNLGREIGDIVRVEFAEAGLSTKAIITKISWSADPSGVQQSVGLAFLPLLIRDFNEAFDIAHAGWTIANFNTLWGPSATVADFNNDPLRTA